MQVFRLILPCFFAFALLFSSASCKKKIIENVVYDNVIYEIDTLHLYASNNDKVREKNETQYISIMYADLFQKSISTKELNELRELYVSIGDKVMADELLISSFAGRTSVKIPTATEMRNNVDLFVDQAYIRFFLRKPNEYEKFYLKDFIQNDPGLTPEMIYTAFTLSNEYKFY